LVFAKMLTYGNDLGLYAEAIEGRASSVAPCAGVLPHLALISGAVNLDRLLGEKKSFTARSAATLRGVLSERGH